MAKNRAKSQALHIPAEVPAGTLSGEAVLLGGVAPAVTLTARGEGGNTPTQASVWRDGSWFLEVDGEVTTYFQPIYITADRTLTTAADDGATTPVANVRFGFAMETKTADPAVIELALAQV